MLTCYINMIPVWRIEMYDLSENLPYVLSKLDIKDIDTVVFVQTPGSFTALRITYVSIQAIKMIYPNIQILGVEIQTVYQGCIAIIGKNTWHVYQNNVWTILEYPPCNAHIVSNESLHYAVLLWYLEQGRTIQSDTSYCPLY